MRDFALFLKKALFAKRIFQIGLAVSLFFILEAWFYPAVFPVAATINGRASVYSRGISVEEALRQSGFDPSPGDLLDIDGRVLAAHQGEKAKIAINGRLVDPQTPIGADDRITFAPGPDKMEAVVSGIEEIIVPPEISGEGRYVVVAAAGNRGRKLVSRGKISRKLLVARQVNPARPMLVNRTDVRPEKVVALTFDDGPNPPYTGQIVDILRRMQATATFFVIGRQAAMYPRAVKKAHEAGFQIANHSFSHNRLDASPEPIVMTELDAVVPVVRPIIGYEPRWFRPPYGAVSGELAEMISRKGYRLVKWNIDTEDWRAASPEQIVDRVMSAVAPETIVLMHDGGGNRAHTVTALPRIIQGLREKGYAFVTLDQLVSK